MIRLATGFEGDFYRGGIIDKTNVCEADSRMGWHDNRLWVMYSKLVLQKIGIKPLIGYL